MKITYSYYGKLANIESLEESEKLKNGYLCFYRSTLADFNYNFNSMTSGCYSFLGSGYYRISGLAKDDISDNFICGSVENVLVDGENENKLNFDGFFSLTDGQYMFAYSDLYQIGKRFPNLQKSNNMFQGCYYLVSANGELTEPWNIAMNSVLYDEFEQLKETDVYYTQQPFEMRNISEYAYMFMGCENLKFISICNNFDITYDAKYVSCNEGGECSMVFPENKDETAIFYNVPAASCLYLNILNFSNSSGMFYNCTSLEVVDLPYLQADYELSGDIKSYINPFAGCTNLKYISTNPSIFGYTLFTKLGCNPLKDITAFRGFQLPSKCNNQADYERLLSGKLTQGEKYTIWCGLFSFLNSINYIPEGGSNEICINLDEEVLNIPDGFYKYSDENIDRYENIYGSISWAYAVIPTMVVLERDYGWKFTGNLYNKLKSIPNTKPYTSNDTSTYKSLWDFWV